ncbi:MAG: hypothetical protein HY060_02505 [Proteobacteria bacterium]|nr:hypothetical protein [Pseudomonadota bacterium]
MHDDLVRVAHIQNATVESLEFGLVPEHGIFASDAWWKAIIDGVIPTHSVTGRITRVYMGSMNDWPEFEMEDDGGVKITWSQFGSVPGAKDAYVTGRLVRVDYVRQKPKSTEVFQHIDTPIRVWVEDAS